MLRALERLGLANALHDERTQILEAFQRFLVGKVVEFHNRERLRVIYDPSKTTWQLIHELLALARDTGKEGPVAQHLVGAKLELRFPTRAIGNQSYSTADEQLGRSGDFQVGDTAIHVTVAPTPGVYQKCMQNIASGLRAYLLVPDRVLIGTRQNIESTLPGRITADSIESFVGQNIEELSEFTTTELLDSFRRVWEIYNRRVDVVEIDKSMLIEIPRNLTRP